MVMATVMVSQWRWAEDWELPLDFGWLSEIFVSLQQVQLTHRVMLLAWIETVLRLV
jgi:hypothetical protein